MLARSALITRWNSNQVPWHPSRELHRVPARSSNQSRPPWITRWNSNPARPMDPWLCIMLAHGSKVVHTSGPWIQGCASCWPMDPRLCILPAHGSKVVHHAGPWIQGCASCWPPWDPRLCIMLAPVGSIEGTASSPLPWGLHHAGPVGVDHSMELQPGPLASMVVHRVPARSSNHARPPWNRLRELGAISNPSMEGKYSSSSSSSSSYSSSENCPN